MSWHLRKVLDATEGSASIQALLTPRILLPSHVPLPTQPQRAPPLPSPFLKFPTSSQLPPPWHLLPNPLCPIRTPVPSSHPSYRSPCVPPPTAGRGHGAAQGTTDQPEEGEPQNLPGKTPPSPGLVSLTHRLYRFWGFHCRSRVEGFQIIYLTLYGLVYSEC